MKRFFIKNSPFILAGLGIGILVILQLKSNVAYVGSHLLDEYELHQELIAMLQADQTELEQQLSDLSARVEIAQAEAADLSDSVDTEYLNRLKKELGLTEVSGQGVQIYLNDNENSNRQDLNTDLSTIINASDLRDVINVLRNFPHQAITINDQRVVATSPVSSAGNNILVNHFQVSPPFEVNIITDVPELVIQKLTENETLKNLTERSETAGIVFKYKQDDLFFAPVYIGGYRSNYLKAQNE